MKIFHAPLLLLATLLVAIGCQAPESEDASRPVRADLPDWVTEEIIDSLKVGMERSERQNEVPIGAVCLVGTPDGPKAFVGSNSIRYDVAGHAEINALQSALDALGPESLLPDSTWILTSFEPCPMCTGALADIWGLPPEHVAIAIKKRPEWRMSERDAVRTMREGWVMTGLDSLQREVFCRDGRYAEEYPGDCP